MRRLLMKFYLWKTDWSFDRWYRKSMRDIKRWDRKLGI
jgi:hypothetical protein